jgi:hypothetical protein
MAVPEPLERPVWDPFPSRNQLKRKEIRKKCIPSPLLAACTVFGALFSSKCNGISEI